jgi:hypothetical protein
LLKVLKKASFEGGIGVNWDKPIILSNSTLLQKGYWAWSDGGF